MPRELNAVEVIVEVAMPELETQGFRGRLGNWTSSKQSAPPFMHKTLPIRDVRLMTHEDCEWIYESGMPLPKYNVTIFQDGGWWGMIDPVNEKNAAEGDDLQSVVRLFGEKGSGEEVRLRQ